MSEWLHRRFLWTGPWCMRREFSTLFPWSRLHWFASASKRIWVHMWALPERILGEWGRVLRSDKPLISSRIYIYIYIFFFFWLSLTFKVRKRTKLGKYRQREQVGRARNLKSSDPEFEMSPHTLTQLRYLLLWRIQTIKVKSCLPNSTL